MSEILEKKIGAKVNQTPVVSVIIPAYNVAGFISETLDSVFSQTYRNYEIVLVNDGSPDTPALENALENYYENIVYIKQTNGGTATARNTAIENSRGEFLAFLDGDDIWLPDYLESQLGELDDKKCDLIYCDATLFGASCAKGETFMTKARSHGAVTAESLISGNCSVITSGTIARREKIVEAGMFDANLPRIGMEDFDLWFRLAKTGAKLDFQKKILLKYRIRADSLSGSNVQRAERGVKALDIISRKYDLNAAEKNALEKQGKKIVIQLEIEKGKLNLAQENFDAARENFRAANRHNPKLKLIVLARLLQLNPRITRWLFRALRSAEFSFVSDGEKAKSND
ncbi:MAG: glycosyltransferase family 2 protein [Pyrinomonadaceae bacterium]